MAEASAVDDWPLDDSVSFDLTMRFASQRVVVGVRGELDSLTAPALHGVLDALVDSGHLDIVADVNDLGFIDAAGLRVLATMSGGLRSASGALTIRSPSVMIRRILGITAMSDLIEIGPTAPTLAPLGPDLRSADPSRSLGAVRSPPDTHAPANVSVLPAGNDVIDAALRLVTALTRATVAGADGVSVSLTRHGKLITVAASDETIAQMDRDQYATGEGPCLSAAAEGRWFHVESLAEEVRWPRFVPRAIEGGIASILSTPLLVSERPVGALNIYSNTAGAFGPHDQELAALFAIQASSILAEAQADLTIDEVTTRLRDTLNAREIIAQAQGVLMAQRGVPADVAYAALRQSSKQLGVTVRARAVAIVTSVRRDDLIGQAWT